MKRKGIILAGGSGTRLYPATAVISKQLLPVYDKPMIYYPLSTLMVAGIQEVLIISSPIQLPMFQTLLGNGHQLGMHIAYAAQTEPRGIAEALMIAESFLAHAPSTLILGDNLFFGQGLSELLTGIVQKNCGATLFASRVRDPERFGVVTFNTQGKAITLEEKPKLPKSDFAATGLYFYDETASERARTLKPSQRGELEITDLNKLYLDDEILFVEPLGRGIAWLDAGTPNALLQASMFIEVLSERQSLKVACLEEIAWRNRWISTNELLKFTDSIRNSDYGKYLIHLVEVENSVV